MTGRCSKSSEHTHDCDICGVTPETIYDARLLSGQWAWTCDGCRLAYGVTPRLGLGVAQAFNNRTMEKIGG